MFHATQMAIPLLSKKLQKKTHFGNMHKTNTCRKNLEEIIFARIHVGLVFALAQIQENTFEELFSKYVFAPSQMYSHIRPLPLYGYSGCIHTPLMPIHKIYFWGNNFGADPCRACVRTRANTGKYFWRITYLHVG